MFLGGLFMFGQTKRTGEANMYPKPVQDLAGWDIKHIATGFTSVVVAADESVIAWGASPTYGELVSMFILFLFYLTIISKQGCHKLLENSNISIIRHYGGTANKPK